MVTRTRVVPVAAAVLLALVTARAAASDPMPVPDVATIPAGPSLRGSDRAERDMAYGLDEAAYGHDVTRRQGWYESEYARATGA